MNFKSEKNNERQKELWATTSPKLFGLLISSIKFITFLCCCGLLYAIFGECTKSMFEAPKILVDKGRASSTSSNAEDDWGKVVNGIHVKSGLAFDENFQLVRGVCTACHSAKLVTQNRATREGWKEMIIWMQATQGLQDLGENEKPILDYLAKHYAPEALGRRASIDMEEIEWYILDLE